MLDWRNLLRSAFEKSAKAELYLETRNKSIKPFLRWAGGKQWLSKRLCQMIPDEIGTYYEPFLGGASLFFAALPNASVLSDLNPRLIEVYQVLRDEPQDLVAVLTRWVNDESTYFKVRGNDYTKPTQRAAQFIYLNKTCWNGLYRVNRSGKFNVPYGYNGRAVFDEAHLWRVSNALQTAMLRCGDFSETVGGAGNGDFVYFDPPYTTLHGHNGFRQYNETLFSWDDQLRLGQTAVMLAERGCNVVVSNASHDPILEFYPGFCHEIVSRHSILAANPKSRRATTEFLIYSEKSLN